MQDTLELTRELRDSIDGEIDRRIEAHQVRMAAVRTKGADLASAPLAILANGDSWFDYPLTGNGLPITNTDVLAQLRKLGRPKPEILSVAHFGDATTDELSLPKQRRMIKALNNPRNWGASGKPDAILISGGGNDIAGEEFCIFLERNVPGSNGLNAYRFNAVLGMIDAAYDDLFSFRDQHAPGVPIFGHVYDFPTPDGRHPVCSGPWLRPSLEFQGWRDISAGAGIVKAALTAFKARMQKLADDPKNNFHLVDTQGTLNPGDWANELHPMPDGFKAVAEKFHAALAATFKTRI